MSNPDCDCKGRGWFADMMGGIYSACEKCGTHEIFHGMPRRIVPARLVDPDAPNSYEIGKVVAAVISELATASAKFPPFNSAHEGFSVLAEEVDELWDHVKVNQKKRDIAAMRKEAIQVAAMAMRFALDVCGETRGRK